MEVTPEEKVDLNMTLLNGLIVQASVTGSLDERKRKLAMAQKVIDETLRILVTL